MKLTTVRHVILTLLAFCGFAAATAAVTLEQVVSHEHPNLDVNGKIVNVGRDGRIYVGNNAGYVVRYNPDGTGKFGGKAAWQALWCIAANADGVVANGNQNMERSVRLWTPAFQEIAIVRGFGDSLFTPCDVQAGKTDFFAVHEDAGAILRISPSGQVVGTNSYLAIGEGYKGQTIRIRVVEALQRFYIGTADGHLFALSFDGKKLWAIAPGGIGGDRWNGYAGDFDADDAGNIYLLKDNEETISIFDPDGKAKGSLALKMGDRKGEQLFLRLGKDFILVRRKHPTEMFQVYDRNTGELRNVVHAGVEHFKVEFPGNVWTAGAPVPLTISLQAVDKTTQPDWPVQIARLNDPEWTTLPLVDGKVTPPADASGLYRLRVQCGEYKVFDVVEIRVPDSKGTVNLLTPLNRMYYGRGEEIPAKVIVRGPPLGKLTIQLRAGASVVWSTSADSSFTVPATSLAPGKYLLTADAPGFTVAPQPLIIGPGFLHGRPAFNHVEYLDGSGQQATGTWRDLPEDLAAHIQRTRSVGQNLFVDLGVLTPGYCCPPRTESVIEQLKKDPLGVAPEKAELEDPDKQLLAAYSAYGVEKMNTTTWGDTMIPFGDPPTHAKAMEGYKNAIRAVTTERLSYPSFRGWSWFQQLWADRGKAGVDGGKWWNLWNYGLEQGKWMPEVVAESDKWVNLHPDTAAAWNTVLQEVAPGKITAMTGPYRQPGLIPPISWRAVDEVDLQIQLEQIPAPQIMPHGVDFYKRPGKRLWGHPEVPTDDGTGGMMAPVILQMVMRGADGTGWSGRYALLRGFVVQGLGKGFSDPRLNYPGVASVGRALGMMFRQYGAWFTTMERSDPIAIAVSTRMMRLENWDQAPIGGGSRYFARLYEAYQACLYAHRPATFVFGEDLKPGDLKKYKAILLVDQRVELDPPLAAALDEVSDRVYYNATSRKEWVEKFKPLGIGFEEILKDPAAWNDDSMNERWPRFFKQEAAQLAEVLGPSVPPIAGVANPEIMLSERRNGEGRFLWAVNNDVFDTDPGIMWRMSMLISHRLPQVVSIDLNAKGQTVYEVFAMKPVTDPAADLITMPARLFAILPKPIEGLKLSVTEKPGKTLQWKVAITGPKMTYPLRMRLTDEAGGMIEEWFTTDMTGSVTIPGTVARAKLEATELISGKSSAKNVSAPVESLFGPHLRDLVVTADGSAAFINAANWDDNFYLLDPASGKVKAQGGVGNHYAYGPAIGGKSFFVQGFDASTAEGYHLYKIGADGKPERRFAVYGAPQRPTKWYFHGRLADRVNNFAVAPDGSWVASAGNLGLIVWSADGKKLWSLDWWKNPRSRPMIAGQDDEAGYYSVGPQRQSMLLLAASNDMLITLESGMLVTAWNARTGKPRWELKPAETGIIESGTVSADGRTVVVTSDTEGGRIFIIRDGKVINTFVSKADSASLSADGKFMAIRLAHELRWYATEGGLEWSFRAENAVVEPRISPDGKRIVFGTSTGMLFVFDDKGQKILQRDMGAMPVANWLPGGDLLVATWMGDAVRLDAAGAEKWKVKLQPKGAVRQALVADATPVSRATWGNESEKPVPLTPNLLKENPVTVSLAFGKLENPPELLYDGQTTPPPQPWLHWCTVNQSDSGWTGKQSVVFDFTNISVRVTGITFVEDPAHPESWMRDALLQYWDPVKAGWVDGPYLLANSATHTHHFVNPIESPKFRLLNRDALGWPVGSLRFGEIVFHGKAN